MKQMLCALGIALLISVMPVGLPPVLADDLPKYANGIKTLTPEQARDVVAQFKGQRRPLYLNALTTLDAATAEALADFRGYLHLGGLVALDADTGKALATAKAVNMSFDALATLDAPTAEALAEYKGIALILHRPTSLSADTAKALAKYRGNLVLQGLTTLDVETAMALAEAEGGLCVGGLKTLSPEVAKILAACDGWDGMLFGITSFEGRDSVEIAEALATAGRLRLPNLERISPKTLTALLVQEDLEIPSVDTLQLIPEPDGSLTEDVVIPDHFRERQRQQERAREAARQAGEAQIEALEKERKVDDLLQELEAAINKRHWAVAETSLSAAVELDGDLESQLAGYRVGVRIHRLLEKGDLDSAHALARQQCTDEKDPCQLHKLAEVMLLDKGLDKRLVTIAVEIAEQSTVGELQNSCRVSHRLTLARGYFLQGEQAKAVQIINESLGFASDDERKQLQSVLDHYRAGRLPGE